MNSNDRSGYSRNENIREEGQLGVETNQESASSFNRMELQGSWFIQCLPCSGNKEGQLQGAVRLDLTHDGFLSGDLYLHREGQPQLKSKEPLEIGGNWYPQFPTQNYQWYFWSKHFDFTTIQSEFEIPISRYPWKKWVFDTPEDGTLKVSLDSKKTNPFELVGQMKFGTKCWDVRLVKTSCYFRGCGVEIDKLPQVLWSNEVQNCSNEILSLESCFRQAGIDLKVYHPKEDIPHKIALESLNDKMLRLLDERQHPHHWHTWVFLGEGGGNLHEKCFGLMFDEKEPHREGVVVFTDAKLPGNDRVIESLHDKAIRDVPLALLRTTAHEVGHALNLVQNHHVGATIMNTIQHVLEESRTVKFPCSAIFKFVERNRKQLVHGPDPQIRPGWRPFKWGQRKPKVGHFPYFERTPPKIEEKLRLTISSPKEGYAPVAGGYVYLCCKLENRDDRPWVVPRFLNRAIDGLHFTVKKPNGQVYDWVSDAVKYFGDSMERTLEPGGEYTFVQQLFYTNFGNLFLHPGNYSVTAQWSIPNSDNLWVKSNELQISLGETDKKGFLDLLKPRGIGITFSLGHIGRNAREQNLFGIDPEASKVLEKVANENIGKTSKACKAILENSNKGISLDVNSTSSQAFLTTESIGETERKTSFLDKAQIAVSLASPFEKTPPIISRLLEELGSESPGDDEINEARKILEVYLN